jgi:ElaB/YqjD/DUF883 family membrane-anchored ribosome-binding protein
MDGTSSSTPSSSNSFANGRDQIATGLKHLVEVADQLLKSAATAGDQKFDEARARLDQQLRDLRRQLDELEGNALQRARQAARATDQAVHSHPYRAAGIAAGIGLLVGVLAARR